MKRSNLTRKDLAKAINEKMGFSQRSAEALVNAMFISMKESLIEGEGVKIVNFGTLTVRRKEHRIGRNPRTGEAIDISKRKMVSFKASRALRERINTKSGS
jgi:integration host factor subunit alpha